jgi:hypothetical protein
MAGVTVDGHAELPIYAAAVETALAAAGKSGKGSGTDRSPFVTVHPAALISAARRCW